MKWKNKGHEFDAIKNLLSGFETIYIWGLGTRGIELCESLAYLRKYGIGWKVEFVDSDTKKQNIGVYGSYVYQPEILRNADKKKCAVIVCATEENTVVILKSAQELGFTSGVNLFDFAYFALTLLSVHMLYQHGKVYFPSINIVPSTVCNLNCKSCLNFNPFIKQHTIYSLDEMKVGIAELFRVVDCIGRFQITGGDPLLYKNLNEIIDYVGANYREQIQYYEIVTNGTIVPKEETVQLLHKYDMRVYLDDYGMSLKEPQYKFHEIYYMLKQNRIDVIHNFVPRWFDLTPHLFEEPTLTEQELIEHYTNCGCPWTTLIGTAVSSCNYSMYSYKAGIVDYFEDEYLDLTGITEENRAELVEFRCRYNAKGYVELCKNCAGFNGNKNWITPAVQMPKTNKESQNEVD